MNRWTRGELRILVATFLVLAALFSLLALTPGNAQ